MFFSGLRPQNRGSFEEGLERFFVQIYNVLERNGRFLFGFYVIFAKNMQMVYAFQDLCNNVEIPLPKTIGFISGSLFKSVAEQN